MSSDDELVIEVKGLGKRYEIYDRPRDRLLQMLWRGRRKFYKEFWALRDVSFQLRRGETVGIIGRNGSGKSTLLQLICGTLNQTAGDLAVKGRVAALLELGAGFNPEFSGRENVFLAAKLLGLTQRQVEERFDQIAAFAEIGDFMDQPVKTYSSGMYIRLAFAVNAHVDADILIIDEALAVGDAFFTQKCMRFLRTFMQNGTVLFVSHDTAAVRSLCDRAIWLQNGSVIAEGDAKTITESYLKAQIEDNQKGVSAVTKAAPVRSRRIDRRDPRQDFVNATNLRNDIRLFEFNESAESFGAGGAHVVNVRFTDKDGTPLAWIIGGEDVLLEVEIVAKTDLHSPIVGFSIKDRLGQPLVGDNTWLTTIDSPVACSSGETLVARFAFNMPRLAAGDYAISVAIAEGTQVEHVQHQWIHDALLFRSESTNVSVGLVGIPMSDIALQVQR
jgi:lipopolysaccharide transport system ATP-binding protein